MRTTRTAALLLAIGVFAAACGDDTETDSSTAETTAAAASDSTAAPEDATTFPITIEATNGPVTIEAEPTTIVSISPTATEMLFAVGAGDQVVAVDSYSTYPEDAPITDLSAFEPNVEAIAGFGPDLVVLSDDIGGVVAALGDLDIPVLQLAAATTIDDSFTQIEQLGAATGHVADAAAVVAEMQTRIDAALATVEVPAEPLTYYHELDSTYFSVTSSTFIGNVYAMLGLVNIADAADDGSSGGYPQLSAEYIVDADPDLIFLADTKCCAQDAATVAARPGWDVIAAVADGAIVELDDDVASRWGPRIVDLLEAVAAAVAAVPVG